MGAMPTLAVGMCPGSIRQHPQSAGMPTASVGMAPTSNPADGIAILPAGPDFQLGKLLG